ncbi:hypothetical protein V491_03465, partial [Pseudogymnoascus sp. VKM F-3775]
LTATGRGEAKRSERGAGRAKPATVRAGKRNGGNRAEGEGKIRGTSCGA